MIRADSLLPVNRDNKGETIIGVSPGRSERILDNGSIAVILDEVDIKKLLGTIDLKLLDDVHADRHAKAELDDKRHAIVDDCMYIIEKASKIKNVHELSAILNDIEAITTEI